MKRLVIALVCVSMLASVSFAAKAKYLPTPSSAPTAPAVSSSTNNSGNSGSSGGFKFPTPAAIGLYSQGFLFIPTSIMTARFDLNRNAAVEFGLGSLSLTGSDTNLIFMARYESNFTNKNNIRTYWGGLLYYINEGSAVTVLSGLIGAEILINNQLAIYTDGTVVGLMSGSGDSNLTVGTGSTLLASGVRVYL